MSVYWPFIIIGLFTGSIYGLAAMGVVLTYKTTGVFNFAYGGIAMVCGYAYWQFHDVWHLTAWIAIPLLMLVVAPVIGLVFEQLFRPLAGLSAEIPIVVSLAMLALLQAVAVLFWKGTSHGLQPVIPRSTFRFGHLYVGYDQLGTLTCALAAAAFLWWLLRHTRFGTATRAVVDNRDLSAMIGVNGDNVRRTAWLISSMFAALVGLLLSPTQGVDPNGLVLIAIGGFTAAVLGRLTSLPWAFGGSLALGVFQSVLSRWSSSGIIANVEASIPFLVLFVLLIVMGGSLKEAGLAVRPMALAGNVAGPVEEDEVGHARRAQRSTAFGTVAFVVALCLPMVLSGPKISVLTAGAIFTIVAVTVVVLTGWAGQISLAQFTFVGVGAFAVGHWSGHSGENFLWATLAGAALAVPIGLFVGLPSLRLKGLYLALATFAAALIMDNIVFNSQSVSNGITGITAPHPRIFGVSFASTTALYELSLAVLGVVLLVAFVLRRGPIGRRLLILRDSPLASSTLGVNLTITKLVAFAACGVVAAIAGALFAGYQQSITPFDFQWSQSLEVLLLVVLGGRSLLTGSVIAGLVYMIGTLNLFPIPAGWHSYIQLGIAVGVIGLGRNPEGTVAISRAETKRTLSILHPRPRRPLQFETLAGSPRLEVHSGS
ncbi:MAG TPA: ABC transporter permease [Acidimicrobiales bacterium]|nr:ABC transporter permease [Acidimicrobiales bacterium]